MYTLGMILGRVECSGRGGGSPIPRLTHQIVTARYQKLGSGKVLGLWASMQCAQVWGRKHRLSYSTLDPPSLLTLHLMVNLLGPDLACLTAWTPEQDLCDLPCSLWARFECVEGELGWFAVLG